MGGAHVFVSYASPDAPFADELVHSLEALGLRIWYAPRDVRPGLDYSEQLQKAIETATAFVIIVSDAANRSKFVRAETEMAFSFDRPIFPVRTSPVSPGRGLALFLRLRHWTDLFGPRRQRAVSRLGDELLAAARGKSTVSQRAGPTLFRPRDRHIAAGASPGAAASRAPLFLVLLGGAALILAFALLAPAESLGNLQAGAPSPESADGVAANAAAGPSYDPLGDDWVRDARANAPPPPPPPEALIENAADAAADAAANMAGSEQMEDINGM